MTDVLSDDELVSRIRGCWPRCNDILRKAMDQMHDEFVKDGVETDAAFNLVIVVVLHEIFLRRSILIACERYDDSVPVAERYDDSIINWIKTEYEDWDND